jgi:hypothetical protein
MQIFREKLQIGIPLPNLDLAYHKTITLTSGIKNKK